jgi:hypothetical protein
MMTEITPNVRMISILENLWRTCTKVRLKEDPKRLVLRYVHNSLTWVRLKFKENGHMKIEKDITQESCH